VERRWENHLGEAVPILVPVVKLENLTATPLTSRV